MLDPDAANWCVDLHGRQVLMLTIDYRVSIHLHGESSYDGLVIFETPFDVSAPGEAPATVDPSAKETLVPVLRCFEKVVDDLTIARGEGTLALTFTDGSSIRSASHDRFEAWKVNGPGVKIIATPGGGEPALFLAGECGRMSPEEVQTLFTELGDG